MPPFDEFGMTPDPLDPFAAIERMMEGGKPRAKAKFPAYNEEEHKKLLDSVLEKGTGILQYVGETLDKPGRAARGLLSGRPEELANLIPFSDMAGITDPSKSVSGRDLLEHHGILDKNTEGLDWGDVGGFAAELATDPLSYLTLGASVIGKAGKVAKAVNRLPGTRAERIGSTLADVLKNATPEVAKAAEDAAVKQGSSLVALGGDKLGGLFGGHVPFTNLDFVPKMAQGPIAQSLAGGLDKIGDAVKYSAPVRAGAMMFDPSVMNKLQASDQRLAREVYKRLPGADAAARTKWLESLKSMQWATEDFQKHFGNAIPPTTDVSKLVDSIVNMTAETNRPVHAFDELTGHLGIPSAPVEMHAKFQDVANQLKDASNSVYGNILNMGGKGSMLPDSELFSHAERYGSGKPIEGELLKAKIAKTSFGSMQGREQATKLMPKEILNKMVKDRGLMDDAYTMLPADHQLLDPKGPWAKHIEDAVATANKNGILNETGGAMTAQDIAQGLGSHLEDVGTKYLNSGKDLYPNKYIDDHMKYLENAHKTEAGLGAVHDFLGKNAGTVGVPLEAVFKNAGMKPAESMNYLAQKFPDAIGKRVTPEIANAVATLMDTIHPASESSKKILTEWDKITGFIKENLTLPFPSFFVRNLEGGQYNNIAMSGVMKTPEDFAAYARYVKDGGKLLKDAQKGVSNKTLDEVFIHKLTGSGTRDYENAAKEIPNRLGDIKSAMANASDRVRGNVANQVDPTSGLFGGIFDKLPGVEKARVGYGTARDLSGNVNAHVEWMNRVPMFMYLKEHLGWTPEAAAAKVKELQFDYGDMTNFEKNVMKRVVPFYSWTRKQMPLMLKDVAEKPGGPLAQTIRAQNSARDNESFIPPYVGEGMAVPMGEGRYLSQLGIPTDQLGDLAAVGPSLTSTIKRTGQKMMSMGHPLLKGAIELTTGKSLFGGRDTADLYKFPTNDETLNTLISNSPAARYVTSTRKLIDDRKEPWMKALNLGTGVAVTDVSGGMERQKELAARKVNETIMRENPQLGSRMDFFLKQGEVASPHTVEMLRLKAGFEKHAKVAAKKKKLEDQQKKAD